MVTVAQRIERVWTMVRTVHDPELPYLTVEEMGMVRGVTMRDNQIVVSLTPTYSGCPATDVISEDVENAVRSVEPEAQVEVVLSPAWTTDWITAQGREKLKAAGIAPPAPRSQQDDGGYFVRPEVTCPRCESVDTVELAPFGATACKAQYRCLSCHEPFDYFKCL